MSQVGITRNIESNRAEISHKRNEINNSQFLNRDSNLVLKNIENLQKIDSIQCSLIYKCLIIISLIIAITKVI
jgi:hypothetical protein